MSEHESVDLPVEPDEYPELEMVLTEPLAKFLARSKDPNHEWLWCIYCERFFQAKYVRIDYLGNREGCAFCRCAGFNVAIHQWDTFKEDGDESWPASEAELSHGLSLKALTGDRPKTRNR